MSRRRLVVEADGGSRGNPGPAGYGALVRDAETGELLAERAAGIGTETNNVAEYRGLIAGLRAAHDIDPDATVDVRMDSKLVVEQMSGRWKIKHPSMQPLAREAGSIFPAAQVRYGWIPREINTHADRLANEAMDAASRGRTWSGPLDAPAAAVPSRPVQIEIDEAEPEPPAAAPSAAGRLVANRLVGWEDVGPPTTFVVVRHGETPNTVAKLFCGRDGADPGLTPRGFEQARAAAAVIAEGFGGEAPVAVLSSPLRRARETAGQIADALGLEVRVEDAFAETAFGEWEGLDFAAVRARWPQQLQAWLDSPAVSPPGGESMDEVFARTRIGRDKVRARFPGRTVVLVSHVTPIKQLVRMALDAPAHAIYRMELVPASMQVLRWWPDGGASMQAFNVSTHLAGLLDSAGV